MSENGFGPTMWGVPVVLDPSLKPSEITMRACEDALTGPIRAVLGAIDPEPDRDGLRDTPARVARAWREMTAGYSMDPVVLLGTVFEQSYDELVLLRGVRFYSSCEHHLLPFYGTVTVGYIPGKVVGISKLARLVECYARRLQIQERMTQQIAGDIEKYLEAVGVGVVVKAHHLCMGCRGVQQPEAEMVTSVMLGRLREDHNARAEFLSLAERE